MVVVRVKLQNNCSYKNYKTFVVMKTTKQKLQNSCSYEKALFMKKSKNCVIPKTTKHL